MGKKKKKSNNLGNMKVPNWALALIVVAVAGFGAYFVYSSFAATAFSAELISPANGATVTTPPQFVTAVRGVTVNGVTTQVIYRKQTAGKGNFWTAFGNQPGKGSVGTGPDGSPIYTNGSGGTGKAYDYVNSQGWSCAMGWGNDPKNPKPSNCGTWWKDKKYPAYPDFKIYSPAARLVGNTEIAGDNSQYGVYEWAARSSVNGGKTFSGWSKVNTFTYAAKTATCSMSYSPGNLYYNNVANAVSGSIKLNGSTIIAAFPSFNQSSGGGFHWTLKSTDKLVMTVTGLDGRTATCIYPTLKSGPIPQ